MEYTTCRAMFERNEDIAGLEAAVALSLEQVAIPFLSSFFAISAPSYNTWSFEVEGDSGTPVRIGQKQVEGDSCESTSLFNRDHLVKELDGIRVIRSDAKEFYDAAILKAERTWVAALPHTLFIIDRIEANRPVKVQSHFVINNCDNQLQTKVAAETKLVFRRDGAGMKFFQVSAASNGEENRHKLILDWGDGQDDYNPLSHQEGQEVQVREGSASIFRYTSECYRTKHTIVYAIAMDDTETVKHWHILPLTESHFYVEPPAKSGGYSLELAEDEELLVKNHTDGKEYRVSNNDFTSCMKRPD